MERGLGMKRIKSIVKRLEKLKIPKKIIDTVIKSLFTNKVCEYFGLYEL